MTSYLPDMYSETAFICISPISGVEHEYMTITETIGLKVGDKDIDVRNTVAGGRLVKFNPQDVSEVTIEAYPVLVSTISTTAGTAGTGFADLFNTNADVTDPISITNDRTRQKVRCAILWTTDTAATKATQATAVTSAGFRMTFKNGYVTQYDEDFTGGEKKATIKMRFPAFNKAGAGNITQESADGVALPAVSAYT